MQPRKVKFNIREMRFPLSGAVSHTWSREAHARKLQGPLPCQGTLHSLDSRGQKRDGKLLVWQQAQDVVFVHDKMPLLTAALGFAAGPQGSLLTSCAKGALCHSHPSTHTNCPGEELVSWLPQENHTSAEIHRDHMQ